MKCDGEAQAHAAVAKRTSEAHQKRQQVVDQLSTQIAAVGLVPRFARPSAADAALQALFGGANVAAELEVSTRMWNDVDME